MPKKRINTCRIGDTVISNRKKVWVSRVRNQGREDTENLKGRKADICICQIMDNGQILKRSSKYILQNWKHE